MVTVTGSHQKTCVFGTIITIDGKQFFRQYDDVFNQLCIFEVLEEIAEEV